MTRSSVSLNLSAGFSSSEHVGARLLLVDGRHHGGHHGPHRPHYPYPRPYPIPIPVPIPGYPSPLPGPLPGERACYPWEAGRWGSRQDVFGRWWCRW